MSHPARALVLAAALVMLSAGPAHAGTIVFDFEDGLQGWELLVRVERTASTLLGGNWLIFGDATPNANAVIGRDIDVTGITAVSLEQHFVAGNPDALLMLIGQEPFEEFFDLTFSVVNPGNPSLLSAPIPELTGAGRVLIAWQRPIGDGEFIHLAAFIDNITFHTIPEPSVLGMLALGGVAAVARRRAQRGRDA